MALRRLCLDAIDGMAATSTPSTRSRGEVGDAARAPFQDCVNLLLVARRRVALDAHVVVPGHGIDARFATQSCCQAHLFAEEFGQGVCHVIGSVDDPGQLTGPRPPFDDAEVLLRDVDCLSFHFAEGGEYGAQGEAKAGPCQKRQEPAQRGS